MVPNDEKGVRAGARRDRSATTAVNPATSPGIAQGPRPTLTGRGRASPRKRATRRAGERVGERITPTTKERARAMGHQTHGASTTLSNQREKVRAKGAMEKDMKRVERPTC